MTDKQSRNNGTIVIFRVPMSVTDAIPIGHFLAFGTIREILKHKSRRVITFWDIRASEQALD
jgi:hypothetical protein